jgi:two-component system invasion response regulator UvrY
MTKELSTISVLCVDDNEHVALAIAQKLRVIGGFEWRGRLECADELAAVATGACPAIVLLDLDMPGKDPFVAVQELVERCPASRVIIFSGHVRPELFERGLIAGVWGYISKSDGEDALISGIRSVASGEFAMSAEVHAICNRD